MTASHTTAHVEEPGTLTRTILQYVEAMKRLACAARASTDWAPLTEFVAVDEFERIGTFLEVQGWDEYTEMLTQWVSTITAFETTLRRISEVQDLVYLEIEERHLRGHDVNVVNSMTVFAFDAAGKICHLDVYLQQPR